MANLITAKAKEVSLGAGLNLTGSSVKVRAVSSAYIFSSAHDYLDDVSAGVLGTSGNLSGKSITNGVFDANDLAPAFTAVGADIVGLWVFIDTGVASTSLLVAWMDTGFTHTQNGGDVNINWNASGLFAL